MTTEQRDVAERLRERARAAREEGTGTAIGDAYHFEEAADEIDRLRASQAGGVPAGQGNVDEVLRTIDTWQTWSRTWSGSAWISCDVTEDVRDIDHRGTLYSDLCRLGNELVWLRNEVALLSASPPPPATDGDALREALEPFALWATLMDKDAPDDAHLPATVPHLSLTLGQARAAADALGLVHASDDPRFNGERDIVLDALASSPPLAATDAAEAEREGCKCTAQDVHDYGPCDENCGYLLHHWRPRPWRAFHGLIERHRWGIECGDDTIVPPSLSEKTAKRVVNEFNAAIRARGTDEVENG